MSFINKVVVVTGAGSGVGAVIAQHFAKLNASLALLDINDKTLGQVATICEKLGKGKVIKVVVDLTKDEDVKRGVANLLKECGKIDVLIDCAGIHVPGRVEDEDILMKFDKVMSINLRSKLTLLNLATPALKASKGTVINIACTTAKVLGENSLSYNVSMAGIITLTRAAAVELAKYGIRVNSISPGVLNPTNFLNSAGISESAQREVYELLRLKTPLKILVEAEVVAELAAFLASDKAKCITGSEFLADAGFQLNPTISSPPAAEL